MRLVSGRAKTRGEWGWIAEDKQKPVLKIENPVIRHAGRRIECRFCRGVVVQRRVGHFDEQPRHGRMIGVVFIPARENPHVRLRVGIRDRVWGLLHYSSHSGKRGSQYVRNFALPDGVRPSLWGYFENLTVDQFDMPTLKKTEPTQFVVLLTLLFHAFGPLPAGGGVRVPNGIRGVAVADMITLHANRTVSSFPARGQLPATADMNLLWITTVVENVGVVAAGILQSIGQNSGSQKLDLVSDIKYSSEYWSRLIASVAAVTAPMFTNGAIAEV